PVEHYRLQKGLQRNGGEGRGRMELKPKLQQESPFMSSNLDLSKPVAIGTDHAGFEYKQTLLAWLKEKGYNVKDFGTMSTASVDYPDFAHAVASAVESGECGCGILLCG